MNQPRRTILKLGLAVSVSTGAAAIGGVACRAKVHPDYVRVAQRLLSITPFPVQLLDLGQAYLRAQGSPSPAALAQQIFPGEAARQQALSASPVELRQKLRSLACQQYEAGALANVGGWLIANVEARFAAIVAASE